MEFESDGHSEYPSSIMSDSTRDNNYSDDLSLLMVLFHRKYKVMGDDGKFNSDTWKCMENDYTADKLLDCYPFPGVACRLSLMEYVYMLLGVHLQDLVEETNEYGRRQFFFCFPLS